MPKEIKFEEKSPPVVSEIKTLEIQTYSYNFKVENLNYTGNLTNVHTYVISYYSLQGPGEYRCNEFGGFNVTVSNVEVVNDTKDDGESS